VNFHKTVAFVIAAGISVTPAMASRVHRAPTSGHSHTKHHPTTAPATSHKMHGQQAIDSERVTQIQQALIREHYLTGEPSAKWDSETQAAMLKFQGDQGWQTKLMPDSRALIKLGLGPNHSDAINASESANFNTLSAPAAQPSTSSQGLVAASGASQ
jgi:peptidoglycan hydrolase-like protein with peptidoglycan-binding domain